MFAVAAVWAEWPVLYYCLVHFLSAMTAVAEVRDWADSAVKQVILSSPHGFQVSLLSLGATVQVRGNNPPMIYC